MPPTQTTLTTNGQPVEDDSSTSDTSSPKSSSTTTLPDETEKPSDEPTADVSRGPPSDIDEDQITTLDASDELETWTSSCEEDGLDYAYLHVQVDVYRTLTDTWWGLRVTTQEKINGNSRNSYGGYIGQRRPDPANLVDSIISWIGSTLSTPFLSPDEHDLPIGHHLRSVPSDRIRVFVSDDAIDFLEDRDVPMQSLVKVVRNMDEHTSSTEYRDLVEAYYESRETVDELRHRISGVERAVGAVFGISTGYGGKIPNSPPDDFKGLSPDELLEELEGARRSRGDAETRRDSLKEELDSLQSAFLGEVTENITGRMP